MGDYFLHHEKDPVFKELRDFYHRPNPIKSRRTARSWAITGVKRRKGMLKWTHSLAGRRFYRKLALHKALHEHFYVTITPCVLAYENYTDDYERLVGYLNAALRDAEIGSAWYDGNSICIFDRLRRGTLADIFIGGGSAFVAISGEIGEFSLDDLRGIFAYIKDYAEKLYAEVDSVENSV